MKLQRYFSLLALALVLSLNSCDISSTSSAQAPFLLDSLSTANFDSVAILVETKVEEMGSNEVLIVVDIDNTLLTSTKDLGSDFWYQWQTGKLQTKASEQEKVENLYDVIPLLYELGSMKPTEISVPGYIHEWQSEEICVIALTARAPVGRAAAERELKANDFDLTKTALKSQAQEGCEIFRHFYTTSDSTHREMSYMQGVMMVSGMNKGELLLHLLDLSGRDFDAIVFVDDSEKNYTNVKNAFRNNTEVQMTAIHYTKIEDERRKANGGLIITPEQAAQMHTDWTLLKNTIDEIFPTDASFEASAKKD